MKNSPAELLKRGLTLATCFLMIAAAAIVRDGRILGHDLKGQAPAAVPATDTPADTESLRTEADGTLVVNTTSLGADITGYAGPVPLEIRIREGVVQGVEALDNAETPGFMARAARLLERWNGLSLSEAARLEVDMVSGATLTSRAIVANMQAGLQAAGQHEPARPQHVWQQLSLSTWAGLLVALMAALVPLWVKNRTYRLVQQVLNVAVLGFWCGAALSYASLIGFMSNGLNLALMLLPALLLVTAFVYPLFGKKGYYCNHLCPYGAAQELAGRLPIGFRLSLSPQTAKRLDTLRQALWAMLMLCLWTGLWASWVDYEPFSAFILQSASWAVIVLALVFLALSLVTPRPYCRFVCPLGSLFKY